MRLKLLKNRQFARWAKGEQLTDQALCSAVREIERGLVDAKLGGFLLKKRISKGHKGKSGGLRTIIAKSTGWLFSLDLRSAKRPTLTRRRNKRCSNSPMSTWR